MSLVGGELRYGLLQVCQIAELDPSRPRLKDKSSEASLENHAERNLWREAIIEALPRQAARASCCSKLRAHLGLRLLLGEPVEFLFGFLSHTELTSRASQLLHMIRHG